MEFCYLVSVSSLIPQSLWPRFQVAVMTSGLVESLCPSWELAFRWLAWPLVKRGGGGVSVLLAGVAYTCSSN